MSLSRQEESELVLAYMNLARALARRFQNRGERADDLEQVAVLALVKAARRYSPEIGPFGPFATNSILGELKRHFRDRVSMMRPPRPLQERYLEVRAARDELCQELGCSPTIGQIAQHLDTTEEAVLAAMEAADTRWTTSLDKPALNSDSPVIDVPVHDDHFERSLDRHVLRQALPGLGWNEKLILKRLYFEGRTQKQVAAELGVSQMQVSRQLARTLAKLRRSFQLAS